MMIKKAIIEDCNIVVDMAILLWPDNNIEDLEIEIKELISTDNNAFFICFEDIIPIGFAHCSLRNDYVEGTDSSPVGYLEGIFIKPNYRKKGLAKLLLTQCENWSRNKGCTEFASDCELNNVESLKFHLKAGFEEVNRIICFKKQL